MTASSQRVVGAGCLGGIAGAVLGILLGYGILYLAAQRHAAQLRAEAQNERDPQARSFAGLRAGAGDCFSFFAGLAGSAIGGVIGAIVGLVTGAGWASRSRTQDTVGPESSTDAGLEGRDASTEP
jgi:hypothetical protein